MIEAQAILNDLGAANIAVTRAEDRLHLHPASAVTGELIERVRAHKPELLALLQGCESDPAHCWTVRLATGQALQITVAPPMTRSEVLAAKPGALDAWIGHAQAKPDRPLTSTEEQGLLAYFTSIAESDPEIIHGALKQCNADALARRDWLSAASAFIAEPQTCSGCTHFSQIAGGLCGSLDRLHEPAHYGLCHPLRTLPGDRGTSCQFWQNHNPSKENQS